MSKRPPIVPVLLQMQAALEAHPDAEGSRIGVLVGTWVGLFLGVKVPEVALTTLHAIEVEMADAMGIPPEAVESMFTTTLNAWKDGRG